MDFAAAHGHLEVVRFLHMHRNECCSTYAMDGAARNGHFNIVRYRFENRREGFSKKVANWALFHGNHEISSFLRANLIMDSINELEGSDKLHGKYIRVKRRSKCSRMMNTLFVHTGR